MLFECSVSNCLIFIPFIFPIFFQIECWLSTNYIKEDNILFKLFRYYFSHTLSIIFLIIIKIRSKPGRYSINNNIVTRQKKKRKTSIWINPLNIEQKKLKKGKQIKSILFLLLLSIISFISNFFNQYFKDEKIKIGKQSIGVFFEIILFPLLSMIILNEKLYRHHLFSLGVISFTLLSLIISFVFYFDDDIIIKALWYYLINAFLYCLYDVLGKKYMILYFNSPYNVMFNIGLIICIILIFLDIIAYYYCKEICKIIIGFQNNFSISFIYIFIVVIILEFLWNLGIWLTIYYFNPCHFIISESISEYIYYTFELINNYYIKKKNIYFWFNIILYSVSYIINIISSLIFNEIITINCFGLSEFTKKKIKERERLDTIITFNDLMDEKNSFSSQELNL